MAFLDSQLSKNVGRGTTEQGHGNAGYFVPSGVFDPRAPPLQRPCTHVDPLARQTIGLNVGVSTIVTTTDVRSAADSQVFQRQHRKRATLDAETVIRIFESRSDVSAANCNAWASKEGVTPKAVRDIWNLRTWKG
jgi:hypothetical protein